MDPEAVRKMLQEVIQQEGITLSWWTYLMFAAIAALSAYFGAYFKKRGENYATKRDFNDLLDQVKKTNQATEEIKTSIGRRSDFEQKIVLDQYEKAVALETKIITISTNLNRIRSGIKVLGLIDGPDFLPPLTEVYEELETYRWLLKGRLHGLLTGQADLLQDIARDLKSMGNKHQAFRQKFLKSTEDFSKAMDAVFKIKNIKS